MQRSGVHVEARLLGVRKGSQRSSISHLRLRPAPRGDGRNAMGLRLRLVAKVFLVGDGEGQKEVLRTCC